MALSRVRATFRSVSLSIERVPPNHDQPGSFEFVGEDTGEDLDD